MALPQSCSTGSLELHAIPHEYSGLRRRLAYVATRSRLPRSDRSSRLRGLDLREPEPKSSAKRAFLVGLMGLIDGELGAVGGGDDYLRFAPARCRARFH
jgi:hypothetical protein